MIEEIFTKCSLQESDIVVVPAPYENTVSGMKGTINGPKQIITELDTQIELYNPYIDKCLAKEKKIYLFPKLSLGLLKPKDMVEKVSKTIEEIVGLDKFFCMLGGEHTISLGSVKGLLKHYNVKDLSVLQIDAHLDSRDSTEDYEHFGRKITHSTVIRRIRDQGVNVVQVGIRNMSEKGKEYTKEFKDQIFDCPMVLTPKLVQKIINQITTPYVYLTIDVDGYKPSLMPETGTPEPGGLDWNGPLYLYEELCKQKTLVGFDVVEVAPFLLNNITAHNAALLTYYVMGWKYYQSK